MAFIPVPNSVSLCFLFETYGQHWQFCLTLKKLSGAPTTDDLDDLSIAGGNWFAANLDDLLSSAVTLAQVVATDLTSEGAPSRTLLADDAGTIVTGVTLPMNAANVVSFRTDLRGRSYRGRAYVSGTTSTNALNAVEALSSYAVDLADAFDALFTAVEALGFIAVVASRQHNGAVTNPAVTTPITDIVVDQAFDSQRRRLAGRGT